MSMRSNLVLGVDESGFGSAHQGAVRGTLTRLSVPEQRHAELGCGEGDGEPVGSEHV